MLQKLNKHPSDVNEDEFCQNTVEEIKGLINNLTELEENVK